MLKNRRQSDLGGFIHGIAFTSTRRNNRFGFPDETFDNFVFPVYSIDERNSFCTKLCDCFRLTEPTTNEIERAREPYNPIWSNVNAAAPHEVWAYANSEFGRLEERLKKFKFNSLDPKTGESR